MISFHGAIEEGVRDALKEYDDLTAALLSRRGITTKEAAIAFLTPSYDEHLGNPLEILNMPKAVARIAAAIENKERITVWSDYDCDGIPGGVLLHDFLKKAGANFTNYIPHRHEEGFGVNIPGVEQLAREGTKVLITVDCGITDVEPIARAKEFGMDVILTDHHLPGEVMPPAFAVIDPKQDGETYPFRDFCGGGLAWKLVCAVLQHGFTGREAIPEGWEKWLLDMAGLATIADMVPLVGENRVIAKYGLLVMRKSPRVGFQKLCKAARVEQRSITEDDVGFMIAPRVNAASRMGNPRDAFELFTTEDESRADILAKELEKTNRSRRAVAAAITRAVHERLEKRKLEGAEIPAVIALGDPDWRPGLLGLVANSIAEEYERPVFLWGREGGKTLKGSCRAGRPGVSVVDIMQGASEIFAGFGGHRASGGFTVLDDQVFVLQERLEASLAALKGVIEKESEHADAELSTEAATHELLTKITRLAPFGMGNEKPVFAFREVTLSKVTWFGKSEEHLKLAIEHDFNGSIEAIAFYGKRALGSSVKKLEAGKRVSLLASLERDQFTRGRPVRLRLVSIS